MPNQFRRLLLAGVVFTCASAELPTRVSAETAAPQAVLEAARQTVEDFAGSSHRTEFRATIRRAEAVVILPVLQSPALESTGMPSSNGSGRPAVVVVHDGARGAWSDPAFFRARAASDPASASGWPMTLMIMTVEAVRQLKDGAVILGDPGGLRIASVTTGITPDIQMTAAADVLAFVGAGPEMMGPSSFDGWRLAADPSLNQQHYDKSSTPKEILSNGMVGTRGVEELIGGLRIAEGIDRSLP